MQSSGTSISYLEQIIIAGFERAARSFSKFLGIQARSEMTPGAFSTDHFLGSIPGNSDGSVYVLITQMIGDFAGKSYLIFSEAESIDLLEGFKLQSHDTLYHEAVMLEVDHIISAAVVAELADALGAEIYGDIPVLKKISSRELVRFIQHDWGNAESPRPIIAHTNLVVETNSQFRPAFIWKLSPRILSRVPNSKLIS